MKTRIIGTASIVLASMPASAWACAVCMDDQDANRIAYIFMTFLLTALPFVLVGSLGFYIWRKSQQAEVEETSAS
jgi:hypothetical protein